MRHHAEKPTAKQMRPMRIVARHPFCQISNMILPIPMGKVIKKFFSWLIHRNMIGIQITHHILVPKLKPLVLRIHRNACHPPFVHRMKIEIKGIPLPTFHLCSQLVETKLIAAFHKFIHLHNKYLFGKQTAFIGKPTSGTIDILHRLPNQKIIFRQVIMSARPPYRILFGNTCTETMSRKGNQQRMYISVRLKFLLFLQRPRKSRFEQNGKRFMTFISGRKPL